MERGLLTTQETTKEDKTRQERRPVEEKLREWDSPQDQINSDLLVVSLKPAKFLERGKQGASGRQIQWSTQPENDQAWQNQWNKIAKSQYGAKCTWEWHLGSRETERRRTEWEISRLNILLSLHASYFSPPALLVTTSCLIYMNSYVSVSWRYFRASSWDILLVQ